MIGEIGLTRSARGSGAASAHSHRNGAKVSSDKQWKARSVRTSQAEKFVKVPGRIHSGQSPNDDLPRREANYSQWVSHS